MPERKVRAIGNKRRGKKLVLDSGELHRAGLLERLDSDFRKRRASCIAADSSLSALFVENSHELRGFVDGLVAESAAPRDGAGASGLPSSETEASMDSLIVLREIQLLGDVEMAVAPVET